MKKTISVISFLISVISVYSQSPVWYITPGNTNADMSWGVDVDSSGNAWWATNEVVLPNSLYDIYISKIDSAGQMLWKKKLFSTPYNDIAFIVKIKTPYLFIGGRTETDTSTESANLLLLTCLMQGDTIVLQWNYQWDGGVGYEELDGIETDATGIYIAGFTQTDTCAQCLDMAIQKLDFNGNVVWDTIWSGTATGFEGANGHLVIDDSAVYIAAHFNQWPGQALLIAFDKSTGNYLWDVKWGSINPLLYDDFYGLTMSSDSFLYATGPCDGWLNTGQQALVKYNRSGTKIWEQKWGGAAYEFGRAIVADGDSIIYLACNTYSYGAGETDIALLKYDASGNFLDSAIWGTQKYELIHDIAMFGNYIYLVGTTDTAGQVVGVGSPEENAFLLKVDKRTFLFPDTIPDVFTSEEFILADENINIKIYPNPNSGKFTLKITDNEQGIKNSEVNIYNVLGERVFSLSFGKGGDGLLDLSSQPKGIYFLKIMSDNFVITKKLEIIR